ncbi:hypothetical protein GCM10008932_22170 [Alkalibacterium iburiense]|uniref:Uncharacterized protein n=1 Tax=Alkalibacterium iburiense TaxID=290589 RepID=A0ABN0XQD1_9LACT
MSLKWPIPREKYKGSVNSTDTPTNKFKNSCLKRRLNPMMPLISTSELIKIKIKACSSQFPIGTVSNKPPYKLKLNVGTGMEKDPIP